MALAALAAARRAAQILGISVFDDARAVELSVYMAAREYPRECAHCHSVSRLDQYRDSLFAHLPSSISRPGAFCALHRLDLGVYAVGPVAESSAESEGS